MYKKIDKNSSDEDIQELLNLMNKYSCANPMTIEKFRRYLEKECVAFHYIHDKGDYEFCFLLRDQRNKLVLYDVAISFKDGKALNCVRNYRGKLEDAIFEIGKGKVCESIGAESMPGLGWWKALGKTNPNSFYKNLIYTYDPEKRLMRWTPKKVR